MQLDYAPVVKTSATGQALHDVSYLSLMSILRGPCFITSDAWNASVICSKEDFRLGDSELNRLREILWNGGRAARSHPDMIATVFSVHIGLPVLSKGTLVDMRIEVQSDRFNKKWFLIALVDEDEVLI